MKYACDENGNVLAPGMLRTPQNDFESWGTISVAATALAVTERTWSWTDTVANLPASKKIVKLADIGWSHLELDFSAAGSENDVYVVNIYFGRGENNWFRVTTLTLTVGLQTAATGKTFCDTMADNGTTKWLNPSTTYILSPENDEVARFMCDTFGYDRALVIATTLAAAGLEVEGAWL